ncbi:hypothetical protein DYD21_04200 [Rhodohalobacter sp. SW132]|nr:hypothetical protein DYD21_04200 [Rhodohalobacter sp. SW132]
MFVLTDLTENNTFARQFEIYRVDLLFHHASKFSAGQSGIYLLPDTEPPADSFVLIIQHHMNNIFS